MKPQQWLRPSPFHPQMRPYHCRLHRHIETRRHQNVTSRWSPFTIHTALNSSEFAICFCSISFSSQFNNFISIWDIFWEPESHFFAETTYRKSLCYFVVQLDDQAVTFSGNFACKRCCKVLNSLSDRETHVSPSDTVNTGFALFTETICRTESFRTLER